MKGPTEQKLARHLLAYRDSGYSIASILRQSSWRYAISFGILVLLIIGFHTTYDPWWKGFCLWAIGLYLGAMLRDIAWFRQVKKQWPFMQKIINWQKVENLAKGQDSTSNITADVDSNRIAP